MLVRSGVSVLVIRSGTVQGTYFLAGDLPDVFAPGSVVVGPSADPAADVDGAFPGGADDWTGLLAGAGVFAVERGLVAAGPGPTPVRIRVAETDHPVTVHVPVGGYAGDTAISGVPGTAARVLVEFPHTTRLPTGRVRDDLGGVPVTLIGGDVPMVLIPAAALGVTGHETPARLEYDERLRATLERLRMLAGRLIGLGDVTDRPVPEMCLVAPPATGGGLCVRTFVPRGLNPALTSAPHRVHPAIDFRSAVTVAAAAALPGSVAARLRRPAVAEVLRLEHPAGYLDVRARAIVTTARPLLDGRLPRL